VDFLEIIITRFSVGPVLYCVLAAGICVYSQNILFWVTSYWNSGQPISPIFRGQDSKKVVSKHRSAVTTTHCVVAQKSTVLIFIVAESWNHAVLRSDWAHTHTKKNYISCHQCKMKCQDRLGLNIPQFLEAVFRLWPLVTGLSL